MTKASYYIHWNFHKKLFSIKRGKEDRQYLDFVVLTNCTFRIRWGGYKRFLAEGVKNVHAFIVARDISQKKRVSGHSIAIAYAPSKHPYFYNVASGRRIDSVDYIVCRVVDGKPILMGYYNDSHTKRNVSYDMQTKEKV